MRRPLNLLAAAMLAGPLLLCGCPAAGPSQLDQLVAQRDQGREQVRQLQATNEGLQAMILDQRQQIKTLQALGDARLEKLYHVERIDLGQYTGGINTDDQAGDDAIKVYLQPIDQYGSVIKAAGEVTVQLFDLAMPPQENLIGQYKWNVDEVAKLWSSGFLVYHYSFLCPWQHGVPKHDQITVRVEFVDYLTGKHFTAQKVCTIALPPQTQPASKPQGK